MNKEEAIKQLLEIVELFKRGINIRINATDIKAIEILVSEIKGGNNVNKN